jgi:AcrR family transcriptional regulator
MTRRTTDDTRQLLLDVALELLHERGVHVAVTHVRLSDVATEAGLTTGAAYRCWPNQDTFHRDLAVAAVQWRDHASIATTVERIRELVDERAPLAEVLRVGAAANIYRYPEDAPFLISVALRTCAPADSELAVAARERLDSSIENFSSLYDALLHWYGRRMRAPFTIDDLALTLAALSEGFTIQSMAGTPHASIERDDVDAGIGSDWTLLGCAVESIVDRFTESIPQGAHSDGPWDQGATQVRTRPR